MSDASWYKEAIIYSLDVETFQDSDGDGVGDFRGLTGRLGYLQELGVTCLWILPFYPTPNRDNGYDVADYYDVDGRLGTLGDFDAFVREADRRGIRVMADLVLHHTSSEHPWFLEARRDPRSRYRDYYVWSDERPDPSSYTPAFPGQQREVWTWDERAGAYYRHRFYRHQPDLDTTHPAVREEFRRIIDFWVDHGVAGFRIDAAHYLPRADEAEADREQSPEVSHGFVWELRKHLDELRADAILMAEADVHEARVAEFFGAGDEAHMVLNFLLNQSAFLAMARGMAAPIAERLRSLPDLPPTCQWANFIRNHDELTLSWLTDDEREEVFGAFGPEQRMQIYHRGIRRRLPPMVDGDRRRIGLAYSLLLTMPGTPVLRYGEEIGMGDDLALPGRNAVRTVMQWSADANGGFSAAPRDAFVRPVIDSGPYAFGLVNVEAQRDEPGSMLRWLQRALRVRRSCPEFGRGECVAVDAGRPEVLATLHRLDAAALLALHNLADRPAEAAIDRAILPGGSLEDLLGDRHLRPADDGPVRVPLGPYDYRWYRLA